MVQIMRAVGIAVVCLAGSAVPASAQTAVKESKTEITLGYQFQRFGLDDGTSLKLGGFLDLAIGRPSVQGVLQVAASTRGSERSASAGAFSSSSSSRFTALRFMAGVRSRGRGTGVTGYGHALGGLLRLSTRSEFSSVTPAGSMSDEFSAAETKFTAQLGAGLHVPVSARSHVRLGVDYQRVFVEGGGNIYLASVGFGFRR